jgi:hypothetical protein
MPPSSPPATPLNAPTMTHDPFINKLTKVSGHALPRGGDNQECLKQEDLDAYSNLLKQSLSRYHLSTLATLFGWSLPGQESIHEMGFVCC